MATYAILKLHWDAEKVNNTLLASVPARLAFFRDYHGDSSYKLNIMDCLLGLQTGCVVNKWFTSYSQTKFPQSTNSNLDMNWVIPDILLAFKDPTINRTKETRSISKAFIKELKRCGIKVIVRLNSNDHNANLDYYGKSYHANDFKKEQFFHYDIPFRDVGTPTTAQAHQFVALCERYGSKMAVHCHAGLGRTATMIGCFMIKHFNFTPRAACGWLKLCRRGSVMGPQHFFLDKYQVDLENIQKTVSVTPPSNSESISRRFSRNVISPMVTGPNSAIPAKQTTSPAEPRAPRKNNIIHIAPVNTRQKGQLEQRMQKYKMNSSVDRAEPSPKKTPAETKKRVCSITSLTRPRSSRQSLTASKSILHPKLVKSNETPDTGKKTQREQISVRPKKPRVQPKTTTARLRYSNRKSQTNIEPIKSQTSMTHKPIRRHNVPSREVIGPQKSARLVPGTKSWGQWSGKVIEGLVSQSKSRIYGLINTVYSRPNVE